MICDDRFCVVEASFALFKSSMYAHILFQKLNKKTKQNYFDHNFSRSARIEPSCCIVAKLEELNNFYLDCFESYRTKNASFEEIPGYLARARARARAHGPPS